MKQSWRNKEHGSNGKRSRCGRTTMIIAILAVALVYTVLRSPISEHENLLLFVSDNDDDETKQEIAESSDAESLAAAITHQRSTSSSKFSNTKCPEHLDVANPRRQKQIGTVKDPNAGVFYARRTTTKPRFWISLHKQSFDPMRWGVMTSGKYYEKKQTESFIDILQNHQPHNQPLHFVDVGGNIGWYSLISVAAAVAVNRSIVVDVFEPNPRNRYRMCESLQLNHWLQNDLVDFHLYPLGVSSSSGGVVQMSVADSGVGKLGRTSTAKKENIAIHLVSLDDVSQDQGWEQKAGPISLLKVDVEGLELEVFQGAKRLLKSGKIENVFFEGNTRTSEEKAKFSDIVKLLIDAGYVAYMQGGQSGADRLIKTSPIPKTAKPEEKPKLLKRYIQSVLKECHSNKKYGAPSKNMQCNLWWRKRPAMPTPSSSTN